MTDLKMEIWSKEPSDSITVLQQGTELTTALQLVLAKNDGCQVAFLY